MNIFEQRPAAFDIAKVECKMLQDVHISHIYIKTLNNSR